MALEDGTRLRFCFMLEGHSRPLVARSRAKSCGEKYPPGGGPKRAAMTRFPGPSAAVLAALAVLVAQAAGAAERYAPAAITVAQLFERNRHSAGSVEPGAFHLVTRTVSQSGDVWTSETFSNGSDYRTTVRQGPFLSSYGSYDGRHWQQDDNGLVLPSSNLYQEVDPFAVSIRQPNAATSGVRLLGMTTGAAPDFVVEVTPSNGLVERRYYDAHSYLLDRLEMTDYDGHKQVWAYGDYRASSGSTLAHQIDYERDGTRAAQTKVLSFESVTSGTLDFTIPPSRPLFDLVNRDAVVIPARFTANGIIVPVSIAGRGLDFLLDSGSSDLLIDPQVARELGMSLSGLVTVSFAGDFTMANAQAPDLTVAALVSKNVTLSTAAFEEQLPEQRVVGLLGTDFIGSGALEVNFEHETLTLHRSAPANLAASGWSALPLRLDWRVPVLKASYSGVPGYFIADLGADYSTLYPHYFSRFPNRVAPGTPDQEEMVTLGGKPFGIKHITMKNLVLGDWVFGGVQVVVPSASYAQERDYDGLIGRDTLSDFNLIFDYANHQLWFKPIAPEAK
jgi:hypothetical protein